MQHAQRGRQASRQPARQTGRQAGRKAVGRSTGQAAGGTSQALDSLVLVGVGLQHVLQRQLDFGGGQHQPLCPPARRARGTGQGAARFGGWQEGHTGALAISAPASHALLPAPAGAAGPGHPARQPRIGCRPAGEALTCGSWGPARLPPRSRSCAASLGAPRRRTCSEHGERQRQQEVGWLGAHATGGARSLQTSSCP